MQRGSSCNLVGGSRKRRPEYVFDFVYKAETVKHAIAGFAPRRIEAVGAPYRRAVRVTRTTRRVTGGRTRRARRSALSRRTGPDDGVDSDAEPLRAIAPDVRAEYLDAWLRWEPTR